MRLLQESADIEGGEVLLDGVDLLRLSEEELRLARFADIALIPQGAMNSLNPMMKVGEQLRDTIRAHRKGLNSGLNVEVRIREVLESVELHVSSARWGGGASYSACRLNRQNSLPSGSASTIHETSGV
jgi:peptide/nickel transport system ATP-binding protein